MPPRQIQLADLLRLERCPHCGVAEPNLVRIFQHGTNRRRPDQLWSVYECHTCGQLVTAMAIEYDPNKLMQKCFPEGLPALSDTIPERAREYLRQARESLGQPSGAVMLCASAVDAMLKDKGLKNGSLNARIDQAARDHLITEDMAKWAHQVRLDANDERHVDEAAPMPEQDDAERSVSFAMALADVLYVIPARVTRGLTESQPGGTH